MERRLICNAFFLGISFSLMAMVFLAFLSIAVSCPLIVAEKIMEPIKIGLPSLFSKKVLKEPLYVSGWISDGKGVSSFVKNIELFDEINPVFYQVKKDGTLFTSDSASYGKKEELIIAAYSKKILLVPTLQDISLNSTEATMRLLKDENHINEIVKVVVENGYDGIDIDYENLSPKGKDDFTSFVQKLGAKLKEKEKQLSITVNYKTSDTQIWAMPGTQDWGKLLEHVDTLKVMVYNCHTLRTKPGPIAPLSLIKAVLDYAARFENAKGKIVIGIPFYGYDWPRRAVRACDVTKLLKDRNVKIMREDLKHSGDLGNVEPYFEYTEGEVKHTVYYQDTVAIRERLKLINSYHGLVKGVTFWCLGGEDQNFWKEVEVYRRESKE